MPKVILISLIILSIFSSCKDSKTISKTQDKQKITKTNDIEPGENKEEAKPIVKERFLDEERAQAKDELHKFFQSKHKPVVFLTKDYYIVDYISDGQNGPKDMIDFGEWYKFENDFTYQHGFFEEVEDRGKYSYNVDDKILLMLPDDKKSNPSEWKILNSGDVVVLVGTSKFNDNPFQKHMQNVVEKPLVKK